MDKSGGLQGPSLSRRFMSIPSTKIGVDGENREWSTGGLEPQCYRETDTRYRSGSGTSGLRDWPACPISHKTFQLPLFLASAMSSPFASWLHVLCYGTDARPIQQPKEPHD